MERRTKAVCNEKKQEDNGKGKEQLNSPGPSRPRPIGPLVLKPGVLVESENRPSLIAIPSPSKPHFSNDISDIDQEEPELNGLKLHYLNPNFDSCPSPSVISCAKLPTTSRPNSRLVDRIVDLEAQFIFNEIFERALSQTSDAVDISVAKEVIEEIPRPRHLHHELVDNMSHIHKDNDEVHIYCEVIKASGRNTHYVAKGGSLRTFTTMPREPRTFRKRMIKLFQQVFLPNGFPESVSPDYAEYQTWDTLQAFFSTLTGALTTHAVMKGVGVGDSKATAASAAITWLLKDGMGLVGKILFAWWKGTEFDHDCKKWRLFADILNDVAMFLECMTPYVRGYSVVILCVSTFMKSLVGVAGGATRAALTQHQAIRGNMADVSAKDGSQEACVSLLGSVIGIIILLTVADGSYKWHLFVFFVFCHIMCNYRAVRAVRMTSLNVARFVLIIRCYLVLRVVGSISAINRNEAVFIGRGFTVSKFCGYNIKIGTSMRDVRMTGSRLERIRKFYKNYNYMLHLDQELRTIYVFIRKEITDEEILKAFYHAILLGIGTCMSDEEYLFIINRQLRNVEDSPLDIMMDKIVNPNFMGNRRDLVMRTVGRVVEDDFPVLYDKIVSKGWDTSKPQFVIDRWHGEW